MKIEKLQRTETSLDSKVKNFKRVAHAEFGNCTAMFEHVSEEAKDQIMEIMKLMGFKSNHLKD